MTSSNSPLRYPGGKSVISDFLADVIKYNNLQDGIYFEPYAGGAGAALNLLFGEHVEKIFLNDADFCVFSFWDAVLNNHFELINMIENAPITIEEWKIQRHIYRNFPNYTKIEVAFAAFYLNRCNRSGIMANGGPIGGLCQEGKWKINARFNKNELIRRIVKINCYKDRISVFNLDAIDFLKNKAKKSFSKRIFVYLDPPYFAKGSALYLNYYKHEDHIKLSKYLKNESNYFWIMTYDDVPEIQQLYMNYKNIKFRLNYSASSKKKGNEICIVSNDLSFPCKSIFSDF